nr:MAG TPA: hypothetical protein [Caudoviricetes sp.]DAK02104.1 MAG TPA: hypothetical protein [Caudoviricetes sp.]
MVSVNVKKNIRLLCLAAKFLSQLIRKTFNDYPFAKE